MAVIVEFTIPSDAFPFGRAVSGDPSVRVSLERVIPIEQGRIPFIWARDHDFDQFERVLRDSEIVTHVEALTRVEGSVLYYVEWNTDEETFLNGLDQANGTILEAYGDSTWTFMVLFRNHADLTRFHQFYQTHEFPVHIERVSSLSERPGAGYGFQLTDDQREALVLAVENGYYAVPRETKLEAIANELGITHQAASERVRRGTEAVLRKALLSRLAADLEPADEE